MDLKTYGESADVTWGGMLFHDRTADGKRQLLCVCSFVVVFTLSLVHKKRGPHSTVRT